MAHGAKLLKTFDFHSLAEFVMSLAPSFKYKLNVPLMVISSVWVCVDKVFGLDNSAFLALLIVFVTELLSGIIASRVRKETFSSLKLSRFSLKVACYLVLIGVTYAMYLSFKHHGDDTASVIFDWMHIFLVVQIVFENIISILENVAAISGKDKSAWINKLSEKLNSIFG
jgi:phage-related holin